MVDSVDARIRVFWANPEVPGFKSGSSGFTQKTGIQLWSSKLSDSFTQNHSSPKSKVPLLFFTDNSDDERFVLRRRSKNPNVPIGTRRSMRQLSRGTLHIADEPEIQEENNTSSDDWEESDPNYHESPPHGTKRSGRQMRSSSSSGGHGVGSGSAQPDEEEEEEGQQ